MKGASLNVFINTKLMKDRELAEDMNFKADKMLAEAAQIEEETFGRVMDAVRPQNRIAKQGGKFLSSPQGSDFASQNKEEYMETLKGLPVASAMNEKIIEEMQDWKGAIPHLALVRVDERDRQSTRLNSSHSV